MAILMHWSAIILVPVYFIVDRDYSSKLVTILFLSFVFLFLFKVSLGTYILDFVYDYFATETMKERIDLYTTSIWVSNRQLGLSFFFNIIVFFVFLYHRKKLAERYQVELPIIEAVNAIVNHGADPKEIVLGLMGRDKKIELMKNAVDASYEYAILKNKREKKMKRVITYGTFDLLHYGHINLLRRAKALGDYLVVVVSSDEFNWNEKGKKCYFTYEQRKALLEAIRYVDLVIPETCWEQKRTDVHEYHIDTFVMGDDWKGKFDYLEEEGVEVVYLSRTPEISTTQIKEDLNQK